MKAAELLVSAIDSRGAKHKDIAEALHSKTSTFSRHINENSLKAQELVDAAEYLGYKVVLVDSDGAEMSLKARSGSPRLRRQLYAKRYDTAKARFVCQTEKNEGWWLELYQNPDGEYFVAHYTDWEGVEGFISLCPSETAKMLAELNTI